MARIPATRENLISNAAIKPVTRWLIEAAKAEVKISYGEAKGKLEKEIGFKTIFPVMMGRPCGALMEKIWEHVENAPPLNVLMVRSVDRYPGPGAGGYMAEWFDEPRLNEDGIRERDKKLWREFADEATKQVYAYGDKWDDVFETVFGFGKEWLPSLPQAGKEKDGLKTDRKHGGRGGEGPNHEALRLWALYNPGEIDPAFKKFRAETEVPLDSADRVDVAYIGPKRTIAVEVKSKDSNDDDLRRGVFQCVKYRAVMEAMGAPSVEAILVTQTPLPDDLKSIADKNRIRHYQAPRNIKMAG